jgi:cellulose synthase/poly-beta-1,6-N-acetylglucosamine synthase-like glycosyltransferase
MMAAWLETGAIGVFWGAVGLITLTYLIYPALLWLATQGKKRPVYAEPEEWPPLTLIVAAYNEARVIRDKTDNTRALQYPKEALQAIFVSAGCTDGTPEIVEEVAGADIEALRIDERVPKTTAQNRALARARGRIVVFSDANSMYAPDALKELVKPFGDPSVGCVCGELRYLNPVRNGAGEGEGLYWRYEQFIKQRESALGSLVGANGAIYAVRRELCEELGPDLIPDFVLPLRVRRRGYRVVYAPRAVAVESTGKGFRVEFERRVRITARSIHGLITELGVLNPLAEPLFAFQVWVHKVLRWGVPVFMLAALLASLSLWWQGRYAGVVGVELGGMILAVAGLLSPKVLGRSKWFYVPAYLLAMNAGVLMGIWKYLTGRRVVLWQPPERVKWPGVNPAGH